MNEDKLIRASCICLRPNKRCNLHAFKCRSLKYVPVLKQALSRATRFAARLSAGVATTFWQWLKHCNFSILSTIRWKRGRFFLSTKAILHAWFRYWTISKLRIHLVHWNSTRSRINVVPSKNYTFKMGKNGKRSYFYRRCPFYRSNEVCCKELYEFYERKNI